MVSATTNFFQAALHLQKVFLEQQRYRELRRESRLFYKEQKSKILEDLNKLEFIFSDSYRRLREESRESIPDLWDLDTLTVVRTGIESEHPFEYAYQEVSRIFDQRIREAGSINRKDPTGSLKNINRFKKKLNPLLDNYLAAVIKKFKISPDLSLSQLDDIADKILIKPALPIIEEEIPDAFKLGDTFAKIQLDIALKRQKKEHYSEAPKNVRQLEWKKIAELIENTTKDIKNLSDDLSNRIRKIIGEGVVNEKTLWEIEEDLLDTIGSIGINRIDLIVHWEIQHGVNLGIEKRYKDADVEEMEWLANSDDIVCDDCAALDGQKFPIDNHPDNPFHGRCRCTWLPVIKIPKGDWWEE